MKKFWRLFVCWLLGHKWAYPVNDWPFCGRCGFLPEYIMRSRMPSSQGGQFKAADWGSVVPFEKVSLRDINEYPFPPKT